MKLHHLCLGGALTAVALVGCDTGFGEPCTLPKTEQFRRACSQAPQADGGVGSSEIETSSKPSCAVRNFAGCSTNICMVYQGSSAFCSETCASDGDCEGSAKCRPLIGDADLDSNACAPLPNGAPAECYCVREGDL